MGWFWDNKPTSSTAQDDPYSKLDPALRDFLDKQTPAQHDPKPSHPTPASTPSPDGAGNTYRSQIGLTPTQQHQPPPHPDQAPPLVPAESLFPDGRYAHLWKTFRPQGEIENEIKSDQDRLADVVAVYNDRRAAIGKAAIENCVMEQMAERDCWEHGSWTDRMTLCKGPNTGFLRCYTMQSRFLKALGYLSTPRSVEEEERIQMHADRLYHEMVERERAAEEARKQGLPEPELPPLIQPEPTRVALGDESAWAKARQRAIEMNAKSDLSSFTPEKQAKIRKQIDGLSPRERELELQLIAAESRAQAEYVSKVLNVLDDERAARLDRRARGRETVGDQIKRLWGWDKGHDGS